MDEPVLFESTWYLSAAAGVLLVFLLWRLHKVIPLQNVAAILGVVLVVEGVAEFLLLKISRIIVDDPVWLYYLGATLLWSAVFIGSRRLAKLILRPWRREKHYGWWLIFMSAVATFGFAFFWLAVCPMPVPPDIAFYVALIRGAVTAILTAGLTPWFIRKKLSAGSIF